MPGYEPYVLPRPLPTKGSGYERVDEKRNVVNFRSGSSPSSSAENAWIQFPLDQVQTVYPQRGEWHVTFTEFR